jgi:hypothetical protein
VEVLYDEHQALLLGQLEQPRGEGLERPPALGLRAEQWRGVALGKWDGEQGGEERQRLRRIEARLVEGTLQERDLRLGGPAFGEEERPLEQLYHGVEGRVLVVCRAAAFEPAVPLPGEPLAKLLHEARFSDPRLAVHEHHLAMSLAHLLPAIEQEPELLLAPDERRELLGERGVEAAADPAPPDRTVDRDRLLDPLEPLAPEALGEEDPRDQSKRRSAHHHRVRLGRRLQPCCHVRGVAEGKRLPPLATAHLAHHDRPGVDADPHRELDRVLRPQRLVPLGERLHDAQTRTHGPLGIVFVCVRVAEVDQQAVAQVLGDVALVALDDRGGGLLVAAHHLAPVLGVESCGEAGRVHQVAEEHRELAALGFWLGAERLDRLDPSNRGVRIAGIGRCGIDRGWTYPRERLAFAGGHLLDIHQLFNQGVELVVIEVEFESQRSQRDPALLAQQLAGTLNGLDEAHTSPRSYCVSLTPRGLGINTRGWASHAALRLAACAPSVKPTPARTSGIRWAPLIRRLRSCASRTD